MLRYVIGRLEGIFHLQIWKGPHFWEEVAVIPRRIVTIPKIVKKGLRKFYQGELPLLSRS